MLPGTGWGVHLLFWNAIQRHTPTVREVGSGTNDLADRGLATFKERWGANAAAAVAT
jgi:hypothetical protein